MSCIHNNTYTISTLLNPLYTKFHFKKLCTPCMVPILLLLQASTGNMFLLTEKLPTVPKLEPLKETEERFLCPFMLKMREIAQPVLTKTILQPTKTSTMCTACQKEKWSSQGLPQPFYGEPRQPPCAQYVITMPTHLLIPHLFMVIVFKMNCAN